MSWHCYIFGVIAVAFGTCFCQGLASNVNMTAALFIKNMNRSAEPCEDFSEFACGRYIKEAQIPPGRTHVSSTTDVYDRNTRLLRNIILKNSSRPQPEYLRKIKQFYQSCMDVAQIEAVGLEPYFKDKQFTDDWPTLNPSWTEANFDINEVIARYMAVGVEPIFSIDIRYDMDDATRNVIYLSIGTQELERQFISKERNNSLIMAYEKYLVETAIALNASRQVAEKDARDVVDLENELARATVPRADTRNVSEQLNPGSLKDWDSVSDTLDISRALRATFKLVNITLADDEKINNLNPTYIRHLYSVLKRFPNRTVQNLFGFKYALMRVVRLTRKLREIRQDYVKVFTGSVTPMPRKEVCIHETSKAFWKGLSKQYVLRKFPHTAKIYLNKMIDDIVKGFHSMIDEATWMSNETKVGAFAKLESMRRYIGYPDEDFEDADIDRFYENYTVNEKEFYKNEVIRVNQVRLQKLKTLRQPTSKNQWALAPHEVDAMYEPYRNAITFLAGILQPPLFLESYPHYLNYGLMGFVIGHEITHGFDVGGSQFDKDGNRRDWWTKEDGKNFRNRSQCIVDQNFKINVVEVNITLDGMNTLDETIADIGGLKESFRAYQRKVKTSGVEPTLPGLKLTQDQLFFLSFAQFFCEKWRPEGLKLDLASESHVPGKYRIKLALQNSEEFAKAYNCPLGSVMNPKKKCSVW